MVKIFNTLTYIPRSFLGPELLIIVLTMTEENTRKRIEKRHRGSQQAVELLMVNLTKVWLTKML